MKKTTFLRRKLRINDASETALFTEKEGNTDGLFRGFLMIYGLYFGQILCLTYEFDLDIKTCWS